MINFACTTINLQDIITCSFELNKTEYELLLFLLAQEKALSVNEIATLRGSERSTVQKAVARLLSKELVERRQLNIAGGGYRYLYATTDKDDIKQRLSSIVNEWHRNVTSAIKNW
ncbi:MarR family transcriptional regulator [Candidatus Woesearchaeota archaeon]|nr:MarR family transcriptional regulator [Candidatus Woesearchaeota archaeon]